MRDELLFLKGHTKVEPLVDQWYAWSQLIPPATFARNITERHLAIMDSYIAAPQVHASAVKNPKMLGGPFVDYDGGRVDEIRALRDATVHRRAELIRLSQSLVKLSDLLESKARGHSLHPLYPLVPDQLRGYVELNYDKQDRPSFRLLEPLLYESRFYDSSAQTLMLSNITGDDRPFVLSTPRLPAEGHLHLEVPFDDPRIDLLFRTKTEPRSWRALCDLFPLDGDARALFRSFFTTDAPAPYQPYDGPGLRWRYFGHACILIETAGISMLFDPVLSYTYESEISRYTYADLPDRIDYVLITHNHLDHMLFETLLQLRHKIGAIVVPRNYAGELQDPSLALLLRRCGFPHVVELSEFGSIADSTVSIVGLPFFGEHGDLAVGTKLGYLVRIGGRGLMFLADSCNVEPRLYQHLHDRFGDVRAVFLGMECNGAPVSWAYGPLLLRRLERACDESRRLCGSDYEQAIAIVDAIGCRDVYVYAMGQEPWLNYIMSIKYTEESRPIVESNRLLEECRRRGLASERLFGEREMLWSAVEVGAR